MKKEKAILEEIFRTARSERLSTLSNLKSSCVTAPQRKPKKKKRKSSQQEQPKPARTDGRTDTQTPTNDDNALFIDKPRPVEGRERCPNEKRLGTDRKRFSISDFLHVNNNRVRRRHSDGSFLIKAGELGLVVALTPPESTSGGPKYAIKSVRKDNPTIKKADTKDERCGRNRFRKSSRETGFKRRRRLPDTVRVVIDPRTLSKKKEKVRRRLPILPPKVHNEPAERAMEITDAAGTPTSVGGITTPPMGMFVDSTAQDDGSRDTTTNVTKSDTFLDKARKNLREKEQVDDIPAKDHVDDIPVTEKVHDIPEKEQVDDIPAKGKVDDIPVKKRIDDIHMNVYDTPDYVPRTPNTSIDVATENPTITRANTILGNTPTTTEESRDAKDTESNENMAANADLIDAPIKDIALNIALAQERSETVQDAGESDKSMIRSTSGISPGGFATDMLANQGTRRCSARERTPKRITIAREEWKVNNNRTTHEKITFRENDRARTASGELFRPEKKPNGNRNEEEILPVSGKSGNRQRSKSCTVSLPNKNPANGRNIPSRSRRNRRKPSSSVHGSAGLSLASDNSAAAPSEIKQQKSSILDVAESNDERRNRSPTGSLIEARLEEERVLPAQCESRKDEVSVVKMSPTSSVPANDKSLLRSNKRRHRKPSFISLKDIPYENKENLPGMSRKKQRKSLINKTSDQACSHTTSSRKTLTLRKPFFFPGLNESLSTGTSSPQPQSPPMQAHHSPEQKTASFFLFDSSSSVTSKRHTVSDTSAPSSVPHASTAAGSFTTPVESTPASSSGNTVSSIVSVQSTPASSTSEPISSITSTSTPARSVIEPASFLPAPTVKPLQPVDSAQTVASSSPMDADPSTDLVRIVHAGPPVESTSSSALPVAVASVADVSPLQLARCITSMVRASNLDVASIAAATSVGAMSSLQLAQCITSMVRCSSRHVASMVATADVEADSLSSDPSVAATEDMETASSSSATVMPMDSTPSMRAASSITTASVSAASSIESALNSSHVSSFTSAPSKVADSSKELPLVGAISSVEPLLSSDSDAVIAPSTCVKPVPYTESVPFIATISDIETSESVAAPCVATKARTGSTYCAASVPSNTIMSAVDVTSAVEHSLCTTEQCMVFTSWSLNTAAEQCMASTSPLQSGQSIKSVLSIPPTSLMESTSSFAPSDAQQSTYIGSSAYDSSAASNKAIDLCTSSSHTTSIKAIDLSTSNLSVSCNYLPRTSGINLIDETSTEPLSTSPSAEIAPPTTVKPSNSNDELSPSEEPISSEALYSALMHATARKPRQGTPCPNRKTFKCPVKRPKKQKAGGLFVSMKSCITAKRAKSGGCLDVVSEPSNVLQVINKHVKDIQRNFAHRLTKAEREMEVDDWDTCHMVNRLTDNNFPIMVS